jgi:hypothetical protein
MTKRKTARKSPLITHELQNILAWGILITLWVLMFLSTTETSLVGSVLRRWGIACFGEYYRFIASPILVILGSMIVVKQASWSVSRAIGILLFYVSLTSLVGWYTKATVGYFDVYSQLDRLLGASSAWLTLLVGLFASLYLTLRISYRALISKVRERVPSFSSVRDAVLPDDEDDEWEIQIRPKGKSDEIYRKKAEELERKLSELLWKGRVSSDLHSQPSRASASRSRRQMVMSSSLEWSQ